MPELLSLIIHLFAECYFGEMKFVDPSSSALRAPILRYQQA